MIKRWFNLGICSISPVLDCYSGIGWVLRKQSFVVIGSAFGVFTRRINAQKGICPVIKVTQHLDRDQAQYYFITLSHNGAFYVIQIIHLLNLQYDVPLTCRASAIAKPLVILKRYFCRGMSYEEQPR